MCKCVMFSLQFGQNFLSKYFFKHFPNFTNGVINDKNMTKNEAAV